MVEQKSMALVILGVVAILAIVGLVLLFTRSGTTGKIVTMAGCDSPSTPVLAEPGLNPTFLQYWEEAGYTCVPAPGHDAFLTTGGFARQNDPGFVTWCCTPPSGVPVDQRYNVGQAPIIPLGNYQGYPGYRGGW
ncbi:MAG: hypothetical protein QW666_03010 [Candidatus Woesearchaeota archaeon]